MNGERNARIVLALLFAATALAQPTTQRLIAPEVSSDRRITFRISAPKASEVALRFSEGGPQAHPMSKGENGVWSVTIGPVEPERDRAGGGAACP